MKNEAEPIARIELIRVRANGERVTIVTKIGRPYQASAGNWRTPVALHGLDGQACDVYGEDSLQSLALAVEMVHHRLASVVEAGDRLLDTGGGEFPFDAYFAKR